MKICPNCNTQNDDASTFCLNCGTALPTGAGYGEQPYQQPYQQPTGAPYQEQPYAQQPYTQQPYAAPQSRGTSGMAVAALILGIIGLLFSIIPYTVGLGIILDILAFIFGLVGMIQKSKGGKGMAIAGFIMACIGLTIFFIWIFVGMAAIGAYSSILYDLY